MSFTIFFLVIILNTAVAVPYRLDGLIDPLIDNNDARIPSPSYIRSFMPHSEYLAPTMVKTPIPANINNRNLGDILVAPRQQPAVTDDVIKLNPNIMTNQGEIPNNYQFNVKTSQGSYENINRRLPSVSNVNLQRGQSIPVQNPVEKLIQEYLKIPINYYSQRVPQPDLYQGSAINTLFSNHKIIHDILAPAPHKKRYTILYPNGTTQYVDEFDDIAVKYPNHIIVNANEIAQLAHNDNNDCHLDFEGSTINHSNENVANNDLINPQINLQNNGIPQPIFQTSTETPTYFINPANTEPGIPIAPPQLPQNVIKVSGDDYENAHNVSPIITNQYLENKKPQEALINNIISSSTTTATISRQSIDGTHEDNVTKSKNNNFDVDNNPNPVINSTSTKTTDETLSKILNMYEDHSKADIISNDKSSIEFPENTGLKMTKNNTTSTIDNVNTSNNLQQDQSTIQNSSSINTYTKTVAKDINGKSNIDDIPSSIEINFHLSSVSLVGELNKDNNIISVSNILVNSTDTNISTADDTFSNDPEVSNLQNPSNSSLKKSDICQQDNPNDITNNVQLQNVTKSEKTGVEVISPNQQNESQAEAKNKDENSSPISTELLNTTYIVNNINHVEPDKKSNSDNINNADNLKNFQDEKSWHSKEDNGDGVLSWFQSSESNFLKNLSGGDNKNTFFIFFDPPKPIKEKETQTTIYPNGTIVKEITEILNSEDGAPSIKTVTTIVESNGTAV